MATLDLLTQEPDQEEGSTRRRTVHPELRAVNTILCTLEELSPQARRRTLRWLDDYLNPVPAFQGEDDHP